MDERPHGAKRSGKRGTKRSEVVSEVPKPSRKPETLHSARLRKWKSTRVTEVWERAATLAATQSESDRGGLLRGGNATMLQYERENIKPLDNRRFPALKSPV